MKKTDSGNQQAIKESRFSHDCLVLVIVVFWFSGPKVAIRGQAVY